MNFLIETPENSIKPDGFCIQFSQSVKKHLIGNEPGRKPEMSGSKVITLRSDYLELMQSATLPITSGLKETRFLKDWPSLETSQ